MQRDCSKGSKRSRYKKVTDKDFFHSILIGEVGDFKTFPAFYSISLYSVLEIRELLYELLTQLIPAELILEVLCGLFS